MRLRYILKISYRLNYDFKNSSLIIIDLVVNLTVGERTKVKVLSLSVSSNFNDFFIDKREDDSLNIKDCVLIEILI